MSTMPTLIYDHDSIGSRFSQSKRRVHDKAKVIITCSYISYSLSHITIHKAHQHSHDHIYTHICRPTRYLCTETSDWTRTFPPCTIPKASACDRLHLHQPAAGSTGRRRASFASRRRAAASPDRLDSTALSGSGRSSGSGAGTSWPRPPSVCGAGRRPSLRDAWRTSLPPSTCWTKESSMRSRNAACRSSVHPSARASAARSSIGWIGRPRVWITHGFAACSCLAAGEWRMWCRCWPKYLARKLRLAGWLPYITPSPCN